jgi:hypothetical protein
VKIVVIADDEPSLRLLVAATIALTEYRVIGPGRLCSNIRPDVALLDVQMVAPVCS